MFQSGKLCNSLGQLGLCLCDVHFTTAVRQLPFGFGLGGLGCGFIQICATHGSIRQYGYHVRLYFQDAATDKVKIFFAISFEYTYGTGF